MELVIGVVDLHGRNDIREHLRGLKTAPMARVANRGGIAEELDVDAVLGVAASMCSGRIGAFQRSGSARQKRWQDVQVLLQAGIDVLTTMNVQAWQA